MTKVLASRTKRERQRWGYLDWRPQTKTKPVLDAVMAIFDEYASQLPLTIRQVFYRLVGVYEYEKTERAYDRLLYMFDRARRARVIPWSWVRDDAVRGYDWGPVPAEPTDPEAWLRRFMENAREGWCEYSIRTNTGQPKRVEVMCEAAGMHSQLTRVADPYGWSVFSGGGAESLTARRDLIGRIVRQPELPTVVLHVGDYDEAGEDIFGALSRDVLAFLVEDAPDAQVTFERVAVTTQQIVAYGLPTAPPKEGKSKARRTRTDRWTADGRGETCQAEALAPDQLASVLEARLRHHTDLEVLASMRQQEQEAQDWLRGEFGRLFPEGSQ